MVKRPSAITSFATVFVCSPVPPRPDMRTSPGPVLYRTVPGPPTTLPKPTAVVLPLRKIDEALGVSHTPPLAPITQLRDDPVVNAKDDPVGVASVPRYVPPLRVIGYCPAVPLLPICPPPIT